MKLLRVEQRELYGQLVDVKIFEPQPSQRSVYDWYSVLPRGRFARMGWLWVDNPGSMSYVQTRDTSWSLPSEVKNNIVVNNSRVG